jgi:hypothetical protein
MSRVPGANDSPSAPTAPACTHHPQMHRAPRPHTRRLLAASHGAAAPAGMALAKHWTVSTRRPCPGADLLLHLLSMRDRLPRPDNRLCWASTAFMASFVKVMPVC